MAFDPTQFLHTELGGPISTKSTPPLPKDSRGVVEKLEVRSNQIKKGDRAGQMMHSLDVFWNILDPEQLKHLGRDKVVVRQSIILDFDDNGRLLDGKGDNVPFGKLLEATGINKEGATPNMLIGKGALCSVSHRTNDETGEIYGEIRRVAPLSK